MQPRGVIEVNRAGFGFVKTAEGDFFIPRSVVGDAFDGDTVEVARMHDRRRAHRSASGRPEARVVRVVERAHTVLIGTYEIAEPYGIVIPDDPRIHHDIFTLLEEGPAIADGSLVRVCIDQYPTRRSAATGHILEVIGDAGASQLSSERIIARYDLRVSFSDEVSAEAAAAAVEGSSALANGYRDIRDRFTFTIDPEDAKDFDDALSVEAVDAFRGEPCAWRLGVHIADVALYVPWDGAIDREARKRGTSVYLADRVVPMLPEALCNDVCSLKPGEDRQCMTVDLYVRDDASLVAYDIYPALMRSDARLTYQSALRALKGDDDGLDARLVERLAAASRLAKAREAYRFSRGGIDFRTKEAKVRLDEAGCPIAIEVRQKDDATMLIEEAMVFANEVVAAHLDASGLSAAFRVHEPPHADALEGVVRVLREFKWMSAPLAQRVLCGDAFAVQQVLEEASGRAEEQLVTSLMLRAMSRAVYAPLDDGHYGLGLSAYCHFTSPIRRYPDLIVHRMLRAQLTGERKAVRPMERTMAALCEHCSETERTAEAAARRSVEVKMAEYLQGSIGCRFHAVISGVATYGIYVQLDCMAEGLVPVRALGNEYFVFDAAAHTLRGSDTNTSFRLGQPIEVILAEVDTLAPACTFALASKQNAQR